MMLDEESLDTTQSGKKRKLVGLGIEERMERRKESNRRAAQRSREKRKQQVTVIEQRVRVLESRNSALEKEIQQLKQENNLLKRHRVENGENSGSHKRSRVPPPPPPLPSTSSSSTSSASSSASSSTSATPILTPTKIPTTPTPAPSLVIPAPVLISPPEDSYLDPVNNFSDFCKMQEASDAAASSSATQPSAPDLPMTVAPSPLQVAVSNPTRSAPMTPVVPPPAPPPLLNTPTVPFPPLATGSQLLPLVPPPLVSSSSFTFPTRLPPPDASLQDPFYSFPSASPLSLTRFPSKSFDVTDEDMGFGPPPASTPPFPEFPLSPVGFSSEPVSFPSLLESDNVLVTGVSEFEPMK